MKNIDKHLNTWLPIYVFIEIQVISWITKCIRFANKKKNKIGTCKFIFLYDSTVINSIVLKVMPWIFNFVHIKIKWILKKKCYLGNPNPVL